MPEQKKEKVKKAATTSTNSGVSTSKSTNAVKTKKARKKNKRLASPNGIAHIHSTLNNTIVTITDMGGNTIA
jgi:small subunit ribosomal protein S11